jgi:hypothetical protein|nr:PilZ domain-containing protein [Natronocella acetinitrilica]
MTTRNQDDRRSFSRVMFESAGVLQSGHYPLEVQVQDLSLNGALLALPAHATLTDGARCRLDIPLSADVEISMQLELVHQNGNLAGFHCLEIDLDSMSHLRRLVELNTGDTELLQRELADLGH